MSAVIVFDSSEANCTESIHDEIWKYLTLTQFHTYHFLEIQIVGVSMSCITRNFVNCSSSFLDVRKLIQLYFMIRSCRLVRFLIALQKIW